MRLRNWSGGWSFSGDFSTGFSRPLRRAPALTSFAPLFPKTMSQPQTAITPRREDDFPEWYQQVVRVADLAARAKVRGSAHYVIFEAASGYTANIPLHDALKPNVLVAHKHDGLPLARPHGAPVRALVPDSYFWKSAKWLTGIYFTETDRPGYWETRGYSNHADPWKEERYA